MFRVMTKCDKNGKFVPVLHKIGNHRSYWVTVAEDFEDGTKDVFFVDKQYFVENNHLFGNVRVSDRTHPTMGSLLVTPVFALNDRDLNAFDKHFKKGAERYRYKDMQPKLFEEYNNNIDLGDFLLKQDDYRPLIKALVMHRGDIFSSDWEVAAMAYAVRKMVF